MKSMNIFTSVVANLNPDLSQTNESKFLKLCSEVDVTIFRDENNRINSIQGSFQSLTNLHLKCQNELEEEDIINTTSDNKIEDNNGIIVQKNRDENLPELYCILCSFKTKRPNHLTNHLSKHTPNETLATCNVDQCNYKCLRASDLTKHQRSHYQHQKNKTAIFKCNTCDYTCRIQSSLFKHQLKEHENPQNVKFHHCTKCSYKTLESHLILRHYSKHEDKTPKEERYMKCVQCDYKTVKVSNFKRHQLKHNNIRKHLCIICGLGFKRTDTLKQHLSIHAQSDSQTFPSCSICKKSCRSNTHLKEHKAVHSNERSIVCYQCGMTFKTKSNHLRHHKIVHPEKKVVNKCPYCPEKISSQNMNRHIKTYHQTQLNFEELQKQEEYDDEPVIYTLDLTQETPNYNLDTSLHTYLINESGSLIVPANNDDGNLNDEFSQI